MPPTPGLPPASHAVSRVPALAMAATSLLLLLGCTDSPRLDAPAAAASANACTSVTLHVDGLSISTTDCRYATGRWHVQVEHELPGLALWRNAERMDTVLQLFSKAPAGGVASILPTLRARGYIPDDNDCRFVTAAARSFPATVTAYEIRPFGERLRRFQTTPPGEIPDAPCGAMGWSTHGVRYFLTDATRPDRLIYVNEGQDGTQIDPATIRWTPTPPATRF